MESCEGEVGLVEKVGNQLQVLTLISGQSRRPQPGWWLLEWGSQETGRTKLLEQHHCSSNLYLGQFRDLV